MCDAPPCRCLDHELALALAKGVGERILVPACDEVAEERLTTELVDTLGHLVSCSIAETREQREHLAVERRGGEVAEQNLAQPGGCDL